MEEENKQPRSKKGEKLGKSSSVRRKKLTSKRKSSSKKAKRVIDKKVLVHADVNSTLAI